MTAPQLTVELTDETFRFSDFTSWRISGAPLDLLLIHYPDHVDAFPMRRVVRLSIVKGTEEE